MKTTTTMKSKYTTHKVQVTQEHITRGQTGNCSMCPVALALIEGLGTDPENTIVGPKKVAFVPMPSIDHQKYWVELPEAAKRFIHLFDDGQPVKPFTFTLRVPK